MTDPSLSAQLIVIRSTEEYRKVLQSAAEMYLYDLNEELLYCEDHSFVSEIPESVLIKIRELAKAVANHLKAGHSPR